MSPPRKKRKEARKDHCIYVRADEGLIKLLDALAKIEKEKKSAVIRRLIKEEADRHGLVFDEEIKQVGIKLVS